MIDFDDQARLWAVANVRRYKRTLPLPCGHGGGGEKLAYETCVTCAWELGRREGHVEAGAYLTYKEAMAELQVMVRG